MTVKIRTSGLPINHKKIQRIYYEMGLQWKIKPKNRLPSRVAIPLAIQIVQMYVGQSIL
jgi:hypothetical protein